MRVWVTSIAAAIFLSVACTAGAFTPSAGSPLANKEHPRLWITRANVADLRAKLSGDFRSEYQTFVRDLDSRMGAAKNWSDWAEDVANYAFVYQVGTVSGITYGNPLSAYGDRAKTMLLAGVADSAYAGNKNFGLAYDWVYDRLSAGERSTVVNYFKGISDGVSGGGNPYNGNDVLSRSEHILAGLAFFGDGIDDAAADAMVSKYPTLIEGPAGVLGAGSFWSGTDGGWSMGFKYAVNSSTGNATPRLMEAWRTANGLSRAAVFNAPNANVLRYFAQWVAYSIMPSSASCASCPGGYSFPLYKTHYMDAGTTAVNGLGSVFPATISALRLYKNLDPNMASLVQWLLDNRLRPLGATGYDGMAYSLFSNFIAGEKGITPKSPSDLGLPLTKKFTNSGWLVMRSGWGSPDDSMVTFTAAPYARAAGSYTNYNNGSFTIDRHGPQVINSGTGVHHDYANRTWATNTLIFPDPSETSSIAGEYWDMGGQRYQRFPNLTSSTQLTPGSAHDIGGIKRTYSGDGLDYAFADVTRSYNGPANNDGRNSSKVASFTRQLVYFHPEGGGSDRVVVYDRALTTDSRFEKRWLLHPSAGAGNITIDGSSTSAGAGKTEFTGANLVTATNTRTGSSGRLFLKTLLPAAHKILLVGGAGSEFVNPYGYNDTTEVLPGIDPQFQGTYRIEVIPTVRNTYDTFLNVVEAADAGDSPTETKLLTGTGLVAARVGNKIAAFNPTEGLIDTGFVTVDAAGTFGVLVCDLYPGASYTVGSRTVSASSAGTIYVEVSAAAGSRLTVTKSGSAPPPALPAPATAVVLR